MRTAAKPVCLLVALCASLALPSVASAQDFPDQSRFQKVTLNDRPGEPMSLAVLPDGRVLHAARTGEIRLHNPRTGTNNIVTDMKQAPQGLYQHDEEGVQGIATDPNFEDNRWVYVYYSPRLNTPSDVLGTGINEGDAPENLTSAEERARLALFDGYSLLSRFRFRNDVNPNQAGNQPGLDFATEQEIIRVPMSRGICCHVGGQIDFDGNGNLFLSTGDDTNPFQSAGYTPIDDRETRNPAFDARRTSGNTNDLRGKILRIRVNEGGGYSVPRGNMFRRGRAGTRPEIYAMGFRNPFRFAVDRTSGNIYVGDYSPDAQVANPARGPEGIGRWMIVRRPGNYGWPFCMAPDLPYVDYDFTPDAPQSGDEFNCNAPINDSRNNTGLRRLPAVVQPDVWYSYNTFSDLFPELFNPNDPATPGGPPGGIGPMGGPAMERIRGNRSPLRWPRVFEGHPLFYEWTRDYAKVFELNRPHGNRLRAIHDLFGYEHDLPENQTPNIVLDNPMDMEFGPENALYTLEYGTGFFAELPAAQLARIDYVRRGQYTPVVRASGTPTSATAPPLTVQFSSAGTTDANGDRLSYAWDFTSDGTVDSRQANPTHTYTERGVYEATLRVTDQTGRSASWQVRIVVGNQAPVVRLQVASTTPPFNFGDTVNFTVTITDDQPVDCGRVSVAYILGHETHGHPQTSTAGCSGQISIPIDEAHAGAANISAVFVASYTDAPGGGETPQTGTAEVRLVPAPTTPGNQGP